MKHYLDLQGRLICGDILTDVSKETFYRFLHYDENTAYFNSVQCEKLKKVPCGKRSLLGLTIGLIFCEIILQWIESKKHIYYVCKQCNNIWYSQDDLFE